MITVTIYINGQPKNGGSLSLNLCSILNPLNHKINTTKDFECILEKATPKNGKLKFRLKSTYIGEMMQDDLKQ